TALEYAAFMTPAAIVVGAGGLSLYIMGKALRRRIELARVSRITADELWKKLESLDVPVVVDVRARSVSERDGAIHGALIMPADEVARRYEELPPDRDVVVYCACPGDVASADVVRFLHGKGLARARVLHGGIEAWRTAHVSAAAVPVKDLNLNVNEEQPPSVGETQVIMGHAGAHPVSVQDGEHIPC
ncbi:MAG TPA: rhodanese-like domain-containing protein, partial [Nitrospiraceae bacterium]|nr:rhodanese-like domain-containing protein [Nitrospiraceae bacterium]